MDIFVPYAFGRKRPTDRHYRRRDGRGKYLGVGKTVTQDNT